MRTSSTASPKAPLRRTLRVLAAAFVLACGAPLAVAQDDRAVDQDVTDPGGVLVGLGEGGVVADRRRVEDDDVGVAAGLERAALAEAELAFNRLHEDRDVAVITDIADQVGSLVYPGFLTQIGSERIADVRRYLLAITKRIERLPGDRSRDAANMTVIHDLEAEMDRISAAMPGEQRLIHAAWMIQELRVSLFAQAVGTRGKVSEVRARRLLYEIEMG